MSCQLRTNSSLLRTLLQGCVYYVWFTVTLVRRHLQVATVTINCIHLQGTFLMYFVMILTDKYNIQWLEDC